MQDFTHHASSQELLRAHSYHQPRGPQRLTTAAQNVSYYHTVQAKGLRIKASNTYSFSLVSMKPRF